MSKSKLSHLLTFMLLPSLLLIIAAYAQRLVSPDQFKEQLKSKSVLLLEFYLPYCGHCAALLTSLHRLTQECPSLTVLQIDCSQHMNWCLGEGLTMVPVIRLYRDGHQQSQMVGPLDYNGLTTWLSQHGPWGEPLLNGGVVKAEPTIPPVMEDKQQQRNPWILTDSSTPPSEQSHERPVARSDELATGSAKTTEPDHDTDDEDDDEARDGNWNEYESELTEWMRETSLKVKPQ